MKKEVEEKGGSTLLAVRTSSFLRLRSPCPGGSHSYEWSCTAQEVSVIHPLAFQSIYSRRNPVMGFGYALMKGMSVTTRESRSPHWTRSLCTATVPTPEQTYDALAPDLKKQVDAARAARQARENMTTEQIQTQASLPWIS